MVTTHNLFHGALYLMVSLFGVAGLFVLLAAPFLAGVQIVVYIGAIAILIIFAIMLTPQVTAMRGIRTADWPAAVAVAVIFFVMLVSVVTPLMDELGVDDCAAPTSRRRIRRRARRQPDAARRAAGRSAGASCCRSRWRRCC